MTMPKMWLSPVTGTPCWPTGRSGQSHRSELSCKHYFTLFVKTSSDCEHQPGGSTVQGALRQPGRPRVELLPRLHQEKVDVDGRLFDNSRLKTERNQCHIAFYLNLYLNETIVLPLFSAECCKFQQFCTLYSIQPYNSLNEWFRDPLLPNIKFWMQNMKQ